MSRINHLITADGQSMNVSGYGLDTSEFARAVSLVKANSAKVLGINLYNASDAPFCLGSHTHSSGEVARRKATRANYFSSFEVKYNAGARTMELVSGNRPSDASQVRYALFDGTRFQKPAYASIGDARRARVTSSQLIVEIGVRGTTAVSVRVVE